MSVIVSLSKCKKGKHLAFFFFFFTFIVEVKHQKETTSPFSSEMTLQLASVVIF